MHVDITFVKRYCMSLMMMMMMMMMMTNCFCGMVDRRKAFSLISSRDHCQRSSPSRISDTPRAVSKPTQNVSSGLVEWSFAVVITTTPRRHEITTTPRSLWVEKHIVENLEKMIPNNTCVWKWKLPMKFFFYDKFF